MSIKEIRLEAASWSPPTWMKSADSFNGFAFLKDEYHDAYTNYLLRLVDNVCWVVKVDTILFGKVSKIVYTSVIIIIEGFLSTLKKNTDTGSITVQWIMASKLDHP